MRAIVAVLLICALSGCYPVRPWHNEQELIAKGKSSNLTPLTLEDARTLADGLRVTLAAAVDDRRNAEIFLSETLFYGSVVAAVGVLKDSRAARNTGGGVAALSSLLSGHYQLADQRASFHKALDRADCVALAIAPIDSNSRKLFTGDFDGNSDLATSYDGIGPETRAIVETIGNALDAALLAINLPTPNKDQLNSTLDSLKGAKANADNTAKAIKTPDNEAATAARSGRAALSDADLIDAKRQFSTAVLTYKATIATCLIEHPQ